MSEIFSYLKQLVCKFAGIVSFLGAMKGFACFITSNILPDDLVIRYISGVLPHNFYYTQAIK